MRGPAGRCYSFQSPNELESDLSVAQLGWVGVGRGWLRLDGVRQGGTGWDGVGLGGTGQEGVGQGLTKWDRVGAG